MVLAARFLFWVVFALQNCGGKHGCLQRKSRSPSLLSTAASILFLAVRNIHSQFLQFYLFESCQFLNLINSFILMKSSFFIPSSMTFLKSSIHFSSKVSSAKFFPQAHQAANIRPLYQAGARFLRETQGKGYCGCFVQYNLNKISTRRPASV